MLELFGYCNACVRPRRFQNIRIWCCGYI